VRQITIFEPIDRSQFSYPKLYEKVIDKIKELIVSGQLKTGEKLPSERELADRFQVSRVPIREALKILEFIGVVQAVHGDGIYVKNIDMDSIIEKLNYAMTEPDSTINELFEAREAIEIMAVKLAAIRRTEKDIEMMKNIIAEMEMTALENNDINNNNYIKLDMEFHSLITKASRNKVLYGVHDSLRSLLEISLGKTLKRQGRIGVSLGYHKKILQRIINRDPEGAAEMMIEHLADAKSQLHK